MKSAMQVRLDIQALKGTVESTAGELKNMFRNASEGCLKAFRSSTEHLKQSLQTSTESLRETVRSSAGKMKEALQLSTEKVERSLGEICPCQTVRRRIAYSSSPRKHEICVSTGFPSIPEE